MGMSNRENCFVVECMTVLRRRKKCECISIHSHYYWDQNEKILLLHENLGHHTRHCTSCSTNVSLKGAAK